MLGLVIPDELTEVAPAVGYLIDQRILIIFTWIDYVPRAPPWPNS